MTETMAPCVCLCVPTFRRPAGLRRLLAAVEQLSYPGPLSIVVVDNDSEGRAGVAAVAAIAPSYRWPLACLIEPRRGHTYAYNHAFAAACRTEPRPDYIAVLDDDEYPDVRWLDELVRVAQACDVDIVGGPVFPVFDDPTHWLAASGFYAPVRFATGRVPMIFGAGNMLIHRSVLEDYLNEPFLHAFAFTGGSDYEFFWRCRRDGRSFAWADAATVFETTPSSRTTIGYLLRRKFRNGSETSRLERKFVCGAASALRRWYRGLGQLALGLVSLPFAALRGRRAMLGSLIRAARGAGRLAAEFDLHYEQYR